MAKFVTVPSLARDLNLSPASIYRLVDRGLIHAIRLGGSIRISQEEVERVLREGTAPIGHQAAR